jgi:hypothetical protein
LTATWNQGSQQFDITGTPDAGTSAASPYAITVTATNTCGGGNTPTTVTGASAGSFAVVAAGSCPAPTTGTINPTTGTVGVAYTGTFSVTGATH